MIDIQVNANGDLKLIADKETRDYINEAISGDKSHDSIMSDLLEDYACNGSYTFFSAGDANPFVGLSSAPCIAEAMDYDCEGNATIQGDFWHYADYMIESELQLLATCGSVVFTKA